MLARIKNSDSGAEQQLALEAFPSLLTVLGPLNLEDLLLDNHRHPQPRHRSRI